MQEKVRLLMEETDCEQGEAELALELAGNDLEQAIKTIGSLLRHIFALKGKFHFPHKNLYGLLLVVIDTKSRSILRLRTVVSYNPALYETAPEIDWYALEKKIFTYRLDQGSLPDFTQELEERLRSFIVDNKDIIARFDMGELSGLIDQFFRPEDGTASLSAEELNLTQFRKLPGAGSIADSRAPVQEADSGVVYMTVTLLTDPQGEEVGCLAEGGMVVTQITDDRDIAHYLAHLIGAKKGEEMIPLPTSIKKVAAAGEDVEVHVYFAPNIIGVAHLKTTDRVRTIEPRPQSWWQKINPWA